MSNIPFTKDNLDKCLNELAKEFRKLNSKKIHAEIILVGGASILINYGFRETTYDMDAIIHASSSIKDAINHVGDKMDLSTGWLNTDFMRTTSYTPKLVNHSKYYKTFSNILEVRTISAEYLIAMKLMAGRQYKNDLSDIVGILIEQKNCGKIISFDMIKNATMELYDDYNNLPEHSKNFIESIYKNDDLNILYEKICIDEKESKNILLDFQEEYPDILNGDNLMSILSAARLKNKNIK